MVKSGMAWVYRKYAKDQTFYDAEDQAKRNRLGLGSQPNPQPPWEFWHPMMKPALISAAQGSCGEKRFCKQMASCDEAKHYLTVCGIHALDKDGDGVPC
jgi:Excalibur calcium-binding domain/Staphylococcal nuclease homologue